MLQSAVQHPLAGSSWSCDLHMPTSIVPAPPLLAPSLQDALARAYEQHMSGQPSALHSYKIALEAIEAGLQLNVHDAWLEVTGSHKLRSDLLKWRQDAANRWALECSRGVWGQTSQLLVHPIELVMLAKQAFESDLLRPHSD